MQIKNIEALKTWLTGRLEKVSDEDPAALAKYVVALVRKDKRLGDLEEICIDQLEVFLANYTMSFVKTLFEVLQNNSYIPAPPTPATPLLEPPKPVSIPQKPSYVLDEDDRDFRRTRKPAISDVEEKSIFTPNRDAYMGYKAKRRRGKRKPVHKVGVRSKVLRNDAGDGVSTEGKRKQPTDGLRKKEGSDEHPEERSDKQRESSSDRENSQRRFEGPARGKHNDNKTGKNWIHKGRPWSNKRARCRDYDGRIQRLRPPMPLMQFPRMKFSLRSPTPPNANVHVPTKPPPDKDGPPRHGTPHIPGTSQSTDEHRPPHSQPPNPHKYVRPRPPMPHYKEKRK